MPAARKATARKKSKTFYATVHVTRVEEWCVQADDAEQARILLLGGDGERQRIGDCVHVDIQNLSE